LIDAYTSRREVVSADIVRYEIYQSNQPLSFRAVFQLWQSSPEFVLFYTTTLKDSGFPAFCWEHPALRSSYLDLPYECIVQRSRLLEQLSVDEHTFQKYIHTTDLVVDFQNLGNDARLVVPTKQSKANTYNHLGRFIQLGSSAQIAAVFEQVGKVVLEELNHKQVIWLNTAGLGVIWLHIRLDTYPKYYKTDDYSSVDFLAR
jgi:hypothetical protein